MTHVCGPPSGGPIRLKPDPTASELCSGDPGNDQPTQTDASLWTPSLEHECQAEAGRIAMTRAFVKAGDDEALARIDRLGPCVSRARRWQTRAALRGRTLMLWQLVADDRSGRAVASTIVSLTVDECHRHDPEEMLRRVEEAAAPWREEVAINHRAIINTRLHRERGATLRRDATRSANVFQAGLFERRRERAQLAVVAAKDAADRDSVERLATLERSLAISFLPPHLLLVLTP